MDRADLASAGSGLLQLENRLDVGWEISLRFENFAVVPDQRFPAAAQLAHVRSVHLVQDRVQVNAVRQGSPVRDINDVSQRVGNPDQIASFRGSDELANLFFEQRARSLASAGSTSTLGRCRIGRLNTR
jgi:hypothetical protein